MTRLSSHEVGLKHGFRSGLEENLKTQIEGARLPVVYEQLVIPWTLHRQCTYRPDFVLPNGIIIEGKGIFSTADRQKHLNVKAQHPDLDLRFVFSRAASRLAKASRTTYAVWCEQKGFQYHDKVIDPRWFREPVNTRSLAAIRALFQANAKAKACPF